VWCITVPHGAFIARRNGLIFATGNSGFPKSLDVSKAIDKLDATDERAERAREFQAWLRPLMTPQRVNELTGTDMGHHLTTHPTQPAVATAAVFDLLRPHLPTVPDRIETLVADRTVESQNFAARRVTGKHAAGTHRGTSGFTVAGEGKERRDEAHTPDAERWQGWGTALKPSFEGIVCATNPVPAAAFEPVVVARKPLAGTVAANVLEHGTGALNIDGCRIEHGGNIANADGGGQGAGYEAHNKPARIYGKGLGGIVAEPHTSGRWPANVILDESQAEALDEQSGTLTSGLMRAGTKPKGERETYGQDAAAGYETTRDTPADSGGASRFFYVAKADARERPRLPKRSLRLRDDLTPEQVDHVRARLVEAGVQVD